MRYMKYVVTQYSGAPERIIIFPASENHSDHRPNNPQVKVLGAGLIQLCGKRMRCYGESVTLGIRARREDTELANRLLNDNED
jgi:hypothetical protein